MFVSIPGFREAKWQCSVAWCGLPGLREAKRQCSVAWCGPQTKTLDVKNLRVIIPWYFDNVCIRSRISKGQVVILGGTDTRHSNLSTHSHGPCQQYSCSSGQATAVPESTSIFVFAGSGTWNQCKQHVLPYCHCPNDCQLHWRPHYTERRSSCIDTDGPISD